MEFLPGELYYFLSQDDIPDLQSSQCDQHLRISFLIGGGESKPSVNIPREPEQGPTRPGERSQGSILSGEMYYTSTGQTLETFLSSGALTHSGEVSKPKRAPNPQQIRSLLHESGSSPTRSFNGVLTVVLIMLFM